MFVFLLTPLRLRLSLLVVQCKLKKKSSFIQQDGIGRFGDSVVIGESVDVPLANSEGTVEERILASRHRIEKFTVSLE